jgi:hypothetical protein
MTSRTNALRYPEGTTSVGTARVREDARPTMTTAQRRIYEKTGNPPQTSALDDIDDPFEIRPSVPASKVTQQPVAASPNARRCKRLIDPVANFWSKVDKSGGADTCWPWMANSRDTAGYGRIRFDFGSGTALRGSHQVAFFLSNGRVPAAGLEILHSCDNKPCCNPKHLSEGTHSRNMKEAYARGLLEPVRLRGEAAPSAKLTEQQVLEVRQLAAAGAPLGELAAAYGFSKQGIHHVISNRTWRHLAPVTSKYRNVKTVVDGQTFDSKREASRYTELRTLLKRGEISDLELQVPFILAEPVVIAGRKRPALRYVADFVYEQGGETVIEDVKGRVTEGYRIKRHLMAARGLVIKEVK